MASPSASSADVISRCNKHLRSIIREARHYIGPDAPAHYFMGQIEQESRCNEAITAFDGGMGLGQFMPATAEWIHEQEPELQRLYSKPSPYDAAWAIRALVLYDRWLYRRSPCPGWYFVFRAYNGGLGMISSEVSSAGSCDQAEVEAACRRKKIKLKSSVLDMCRVNIEYPEKIFLKAEKYRRPI